MPATWDEILQTASFDGVEFQCARAGDSFGTQLVEHEYPDRDGADLENKGRKARRFSVDAVVMDADYPEVMEELVDAAEQGKVALFVHPIWGPSTCALASCDVTHGDGYSFATLSLLFIEDISNEYSLEVLTGTQERPSLGQAQAKVDQGVLDFLEEAIAFVDSMVGTAGVAGSITSTAVTELSAALDSYMAAPRTFTSSGLADTLEDTGFTEAESDATVALMEASEDATAFAAARLAAGIEEPSEEAEAELDILRTTIQAAIDLAMEDLGVEAWPSVSKLQEVFASCASMVDALVRARPPLIEEELVGETDWFTFANQKYGDYTRESELRQLNPDVFSPLFVKASTVVKFYAE